MDIIYPKQFHFRSFVTEKIKTTNPLDISMSTNDNQLDPDEAGDDRWKATLYSDDIKVADVSSEHRYGPVEIDFFSEHCANVLAHAIQPIIKKHNALCQQEILGQWMCNLAEIAYHTRRLIKKAANNIVFKLHGDPSDVYHMIPGESYTPASEGKLRIMYGQRLNYVLRPGSIPRIVHQNYRT